METWLKGIGETVLDEMKQDNATMISWGLWNLWQKELFNHYFIYSLIILAVTHTTVYLKMHVVRTFSNGRKLYYDKRVAIILITWGEPETTWSSSVVFVDNDEALKNTNSLVS
ncbi:MAG: hypothetical protein ACLRX9_03685 [Streptococcus salivarius]